MNGLLDWIGEVLPLLIKHILDRVDKELPMFNVKIYWAGSVLRIDIQPKEEPK